MPGYARSENGREIIKVQKIFIRSLRRFKHVNKVAHFIENIAFRVNSGSEGI
jgi:hypothetical protein